MSDVVYLPMVSAVVDTDVTQGYAVTANAAGTGVKPATTAALSASKTGAYDGVAIATRAAGKVVEVQRVGRIDASYLSWLGTGSVENLVVDANGKLWRASQSAGTVIGTVDKEGNAWIFLPLGALAYTTVYYQTVQELGTDKTQAAKLNFATDLLAANETGKTTVTMSWARHFMLAGSY